MLLAVVMSMGITGSMPGDGAGPWIIGHRGASHDAPENTLAAFRLAFEQGADGIEGDFYLSKDGHIVCIHDKTAKRTAGVDRPIADMTLAELRQLDVGSWKNEKWAGEKIPTIDEVFQTVPPGKKMLVEVKCGPEIVPALKQAIADSPLDPKQILVISFNHDVVAEVKKQIPTVKAIELFAYHRDEQANAWAPTIDEILTRLAQSRADGLGTEANRHAVDRAFVKKLRDAKFEFHTWTINDVDTAAYFRSLGVDSITTNRPEFIRKGLSAIPQR